MRRWLATAFALTLALFAALLAVTLGGDVFAIFGTRLAPHDLGSRELRLTTTGDRVLKGLEYLGRKKPLDIVVLGSSRAVFGIDPDSPLMAGLSVYNAGLNGSHSNEMADVLRYVAANGPKVARVVWAIDFDEFFRETWAIPEFDESVFGGASPWRGRLMHALSYEALRKTVTSFAGRQPFYIDTDGFYHYALQGQSNLLTGDDFKALPSMRAWFPAYMLLPRDSYFDQIDERLRRIADAIRFARGRGVAVDVILPPVHVSRRALYDVFGFGARFGEWKKTLARTIEDAARGPGAPVRAYDFTEIGPVALEPFKRGGPLDRSPYFFEVLHFRPIVGDMMMARLTGRPWPASIAPFGAPLAETVADDRLAADRAAVAAWERAHGELMEQIRGLVATYQALKPRS